MNAPDYKPNGLTDAQQERLALLVEEAGEVLQVAGKILRHGYSSHGHDNRIALEHELGDFLFAVRLLAANDDLWMSTVERFAAEKPAKASRWLHHNQIQQGDML